MQLREVVNFQMIDFTTVVGIINLKYTDFKNSIVI